ncbi:MAG: hypothetical protein MJE63_14750 [Proteobacteria bacterium]|nr:hypothetical protein [Pseudomonadota bacterium]
MYTHKQDWLKAIQAANKDFQNRIEIDKLPTNRVPGSKALITCMDPRVNLEAIGIPAFSDNGENSSSVRIIRTIGGIAEERSLIIGCFLAGINEIAILMHTDCGCSLAYDKIDVIIQNMEKKIKSSKFNLYQTSLGEPLRDNLRRRLMVFQDPYRAVKDEVNRVRNLNFTPQNLVVHGMVYDLESGMVSIEIDGNKA